MLKSGILKTNPKSELFFIVSSFYESVSLFLDMLIKKQNNSEKTTIIFQKIDPKNSKQYDIDHDTKLKRMLNQKRILKANIFYVFYHFLLQVIFSILVITILIILVAILLITTPLITTLLGVILLVEFVFVFLFQ